MCIRDRVIAAPADVSPLLRMQGAAYATRIAEDFRGLHRTLMGDGLATLFAGFVGGPANTTYSENTGVLATTKNYNPRLLRVTAIFAIILGLFGKVGAILQTIPGPVKGGVEVMLFGMIAAVGIRSLAESDLDFTHSRNLTIVGPVSYTHLVSSAFLIVCFPNKSTLDGTVMPR